MPYSTTVFSLLCGDQSQSSEQNLSSPMSLFGQRFATFTSMSIASFTPARMLDMMMKSRERPSGF